MTHPQHSLSWTAGQIDHKGSTTKKVCIWWILGGTCVYLLFKKGQRSVWGWFSFPRLFSHVSPHYTAQFLCFAEETSEWHRRISRALVCYFLSISLLPSAPPAGLPPSIYFHLVSLSSWWLKPALSARSVTISGCVCVTGACVWMRATRMHQCVIIGPLRGESTP